MPVIGLGMSVVGTAAISQLSLSWGFLVLAFPMLAIGVGNGGTFTTTSIATQNAIDPTILGIGTATLVSFRSLGGSLASCSVRFDIHFDRFIEVAAQLADWRVAEGHKSKRACTGSRRDQGTTGRGP